jgi:hypothetical protein
VAVARVAVEAQGVAVAQWQWQAWIGRVIAVILIGGKLKIGDLMWQGGWGWQWLSGSGNSGSRSTRSGSGWVAVEEMD